MTVITDTIYRFQGTVNENMNQTLQYTINIQTEVKISFDMKNDLTHQIVHVTTSNSSKTNKNN